jgi:hypothetical protein
VDRSEAAAPDGLWSRQRRGTIPSEARGTLYPFIECDVRPLGPGEKSEKEQVEKELAEIAELQRMGRHRFCLLYCALPTGVVVLIAASLVMGFHLAPWQALGFGVVFALMAVPFGYLFGLVFWFVVAHRGRMLEERAGKPDQDDMP